VLLIIGGALGLIAGLLTGGSLSNLLTRRLRWPLVVVAAFLVKELEFRSPLGDSALGPPMFVLSLAVLIAWTVWHRDVLPGVLLVSLGMSMNLAATLANGGHMPVVAAAAYLGPPQLREHGTWAEYTIMGPDTHLGWLGDWVMFPGLAGRLFPQAYSPGDLVSLVGLTAVLFLATRPLGTSRTPRAITSR
jgi:Family of unknown function (DUF5317)